MTTRKTYKKIQTTVTKFLMALVVLGGFFVFGASQAQAAAGINEQLNYQGRLLNSVGAVVADGTYNMEFTIYQDGTGCVGGGSSPCSGTLKWTETRTGANKVTVVNGFFSVQLGAVTAFGTSVDWNQDTLWLSVNIGGTGAPSWDGEMLPFRRLSAVPYALNAKQLGGLDWSQFVQIAPSAVQVDTSVLSTIFLNKTGASGNVLELQKNGVDVVTIGNTGATTFQNSTDSTAAFRILNAAGSTVFGADTTNGRVGIGGTPANGVLTIGTNTTAATGGLYFGTDTNLYRSAADTLKTDDNLAALTLSVGTTPAATGDIRLTNAGMVKSRNGANSADIGLLYLDVANNTHIDSGAATALYAAGSLVQSLRSTYTINYKPVLINNGGSSAFGTVMRLKVNDYTTVDNLANAMITTSATTSKGLVVQGLAAQTANLQEWQDSTGAELASISAAGVLTFGTDTNLYRSSANVLRTDDIFSVGTTGTANTATYLCLNGTNQVATCNSTGTGVAFVQGGNSFGATAVLGTNDSNSLTFETNTVTQATIAVGGAVTFQNSTDTTTGFRVMDADGGTPVFDIDTTNERVGIGTAAPTNTLTVSGTAKVTGHGAVGANANVNNTSDILYPALSFSTVLNVSEQITDLTSNIIVDGIANHILLSPAANTTSYFSTLNNEVFTDPAIAFNYGGDIFGIDNIVKHQGSGAISGNTYGGYNQVSNSGAGSINDAYGSASFVFNDGTGSATSMTGARGFAINSGSTSTSSLIVGVAGSAVNSNSTTVTLSYGGFFDAQNTGAGTLTSADGIFASIENSSTGTITTARNIDIKTTNSNASGTIGDLYGIVINIPNNSGTINNNYALRIEDQSSVGSTNSYNIYSDGSTAKNYFAGKVGIGALSPAVKLEIGGAANSEYVRFNDGTGSSGIFEVSADPNGSVTGTKGSIGLDRVNGTLYVNNNGTTGWTNLGTAASPCPGSTTTFCQNGNSFSAAATLGTNDNNNLAFETNSTTRAYFDTSGHFIPNVDDTYDLGSSTNRWANLYLGPATLNIGTNGNDYGISFDTTGVGTLVFNEPGDDTDVRIESDTNANMLAVDASANAIGIGTASPVDVLSFGIAPTASATNALVNLSNTALSGGNANGTYLGANPAAYTGDFVDYQVNNAKKYVVDGSGNVTAAGDVASNGSNLTSTTATYNLLNTNVTTANLLGAATAINLGAAAGATITPGGDLTFAESNSKNITIQSSLTSGARSTSPLTITQANDATNNSTGALLSLTNSDTGSTAAAVVSITQNAAGGSAPGISISTAAAGRGLNILGVTTGIAFNNATITTGSALSLFSTTTTGNGVILNTTGNTLSSGKAINITGSAAGITADFSGAYINVTPTRTLTAAATRTDSGNYLNIDRANTVNNASGTYNVTGSLVDLTSTCTQTAGTCADSAKILNIAQNYASASGVVVSVTGAGTGNLATLDATNSSANGISVDVQSSSTSQYALNVTSNNAGTNVLYARADGRVGIGNAAPGAKLEVSGSSGSEIGAIISNGSSTGNILNLNDNTTNIASFADGGAVTFQNSTNTTSAFAVKDSGGTNNVIVADTTNDRVGIGTGTAAPTVTLDVLSAGADASTVAQFKNAGGTSCTVQPGGTGFACSSDERLKTNILSLENSSDIVSNLRGVSFNWITNPNGQSQVGFVAQELEQLVPNAVSTDSNGYKVANYSMIIPYLVEAFKDSKTRVDSLEAKVNSTQISQAVFNGGIVTGDTQFQGKVIFDAIATFKGQAVFSGPASFTGPTTFKDRIVVSDNTAGTVKIPAGQTTIKVVFTKPYTKPPVVNVTPVGIISPKYGVVNMAIDGFEIQIDPAQAAEIQFNWFAVEPR